MSVRTVRIAAGRRLLTAAVGACALTGTVLITTALAEQSGPPPAPPAAAAGALPASHPAPGAVLTMAASPPVSISIPAIGLDAQLTSLGKNPDGSVQVPDEPDQAGWYRYSAIPGQIGPAVILGHVDFARTGPAVFFALGDLRPGQTVDVHRRDGSTARFTIDAVRVYPKTDFPTALVYGPTGNAQLRLVTCGAWSPDEHAYTGNTVVFAHLTDRIATSAPRAR